MGEQAGEQLERDAKSGRYVEGHAPTNFGAPHKGTHIRARIHDVCDMTAFANLKKLGESPKASDQAIFWGIICKTLPQEVRAEIGEMGSIAAAATAAAQRDRELNGECTRTELGEV